MNNYNMPVTTKALAIKPKNNLTIIKSYAYTAVRMSAKVILACITLTLLNMVI